MNVLILWLMINRTCIRCLKKSTSHKFTVSSTSRFMPFSALSYIKVSFRCYTQCLLSLLAFKLWRNDSFFNCPMFCLDSLIACDFCYDTIITEWEMWLMIQYIQSVCVCVCVCVCARARVLFFFLFGAMIDGFNLYAIYEHNSRCTQWVKMGSETCGFSFFSFCGFLKHRTGKSAVLETSNKWLLNQTGAEFQRHSVKKQKMKKKNTLHTFDW